MTPAARPWLFRTRLVLGVAFAAFIGWACLTPSPPSPVAFPWLDKVEHAVAMAWLAFWFAALFKQRLVLAALGVMAYGGLIEIAQAFLSYRNADILDFGADCAGAVLGIGAVSAITRLRQKRGDLEWRQSARTP